MGYSDPFLLKRPPAASEALEPFVLEDKAGNPGLVFTLHLRKLNTLDVTHAETQKAKYWEKHFTGTKTKPLVPLPACDGQAVTMTETSCRVLASIEIAQTADEEEGQVRYTFAQLAAMATIAPLARQLWDVYCAIIPDDPEQDDGSPNSPSTPTTPS